MNLRRRTFLRLGALGTATLLLPKSRLRAHEGHPAALELTPFVDPLRIPPVLKPKVQQKVAHYTMTMRQGLVKCHSELPETVVWGFDGRFPGPTIVAKRNQAVSIRQINELPAAGEMALHLPTVHLHGANVAPEHDGHPTAGIPFDGGYRDYVYPNQQPGCTLWYHDHTHGMTGERIYRGLAGLYLVVDKTAESKLKLPKGKRDVPLVIQDRTFDEDGQLVYALDDETRQMGFLGSHILVNGVVQPHFGVDSAKYRFRILNGSNARVYKLALSNGAPLIQIGTDGGLLQRPVPRTEIEISPAERIEVVIDFSQLPLGARVVLENRNGVDATAQIMRFEVVKKVKDPKSLPLVLVPWQEVPEEESVTVREFHLGRQVVNGEPTWTINGQAYDPASPPLARPVLGTVEHWKFVNPTIHPHPMHVHLVQFQVVNIDGEPQEASDFGWKDTVVVPPGSEVTVVARFSGYTGRYVFHCHNLEHEDFAMMGEFEVVPVAAT
jgi:spore coat protein A